MTEEYNALLKNNTWTLVPITNNMHVVDNKWIFKTKFKAHGTVQKLKAKLFVKGI